MKRSPRAGLAYADLPGTAAWEPLRWAEVPEGLRWADLEATADDRDSSEDDLDAAAEVLATELATLERLGELGEAA